MKKTFTFLLAAGVAIGAYASGGSTPLRPQRSLSMKDMQKEFTRIPQNHLQEGIALPENQFNLSSDNLLPEKNMRTKTPGGTTIYGYGTYTSRLYNSNYPGLFLASDVEVPFMAKWKCWFTANVEAEGDTFDMQSGWYHNGEVYLFGQRLFYGFWEEGSVLARCAFKDGEPLEVQFNDDLEQQLTHLAYCTLNEDDNMIYGCGYTGSRKRIFAKAPLNDITSVTEICELEYYDMPVGITYNSDDKQIYGVTADGRFVRYGKDGSVETMVDERDLTEAAPQFIATLQGVCYSPSEQAFFWNAIEETGRSGLVRIDTKDWKVTRLWDYKYHDRFTFLMTTNQPIKPTAPAAPTIDDVVFEGPSPDGYVEFTLPTVKFNGDRIAAGRIGWQLNVDDTLYNLGESAPGRQVKVPVVGLTLNMNHEFEVMAVIDGVTGPTSYRKKYIGNDKPAAPDNVNLTFDGLVTWDAVTTGANGGYFDPEGVLYKVYINGKPVGQTTSLSFQTQLPYVTDMTAFEAHVIAAKGKLESPIGYSNKVILGNPFKPDFRFYPTAAQVDFCQMITLSGNEIGAYALEQIGNCFYFEGSEDEATDCWLILPAVEFDQLKKYYQFTYKTMATVGGEFTVTPYIGEHPDLDCMKQLGDAVGPDEAYNEHSIYFKPESKGVYYIALHVEGPVTEEVMIINNMNVLNSYVTDQSPAEVTNVRLDSAPEGKLTADVSFRMPTRTALGEKLPEDTEITCDVRSNSYTVVTGKPGETVKCKVGTVQSKYNKNSDRWSLSQVTITPSVGKHKGIPVTDEVFSGIDVPGQVSELGFTVDADNLGMHITWAAPTESMNGYYCPEDEISYWVYRLEEDDFFGGFDYIYEGRTDEYDFNVRIPEGSEQKPYYYMVIARSAAGEQNGMVMVDLLGEPRKLPYGVSLQTADESNAGTRLNELVLYDQLDWNVSTWASCINVVKAQWPDLENVQNKNGYAFFCLGQPDELAVVSARKFSTMGTDEASVSLTAYTGEGSPTIMLWGETAGLDRRLVIGTMQGGDEPVTTERFSLPQELQNRQWVCVYALAFYQRPNELFSFLAFDASATGGTSGVKGVDFNEKVIFSGQGHIRLLGFDGENATVSRLDGTVVSRPRVNGNDFRVVVEPGVYVVKAGDKSRKVVVK